MGEGCDGFTLIVGTICFVIAFCTLIFGFAWNHKYNSRFTQGTCVLAPGKVFDEQCQISRPGCWWCWHKVPCWVAVEGVRVQGLAPVSYIYVGTFADKVDAQNAINYTDGTPYGTCYYTEGGNYFVMQLKDERSLLIAGCVFAALLGATLLGWVIVWVRDRYKIVRRGELDPLARAQKSINN